MPWFNSTIKKARLINFCIYYKIKLKFLLIKSYNENQKIKLQTNYVMNKANVYPLIANIFKSFNYIIYNKDDIQFISDIKVDLNP